MFLRRSRDQQGAQSKEASRNVFSPQDRSRDREASQQRNVLPVKGVQSYFQTQIFLRKGYDKDFYDFQSYQKNPKKESSMFGFAHHRKSREDEDKQAATTPAQQPSRPNEQKSSRFKSLRLDQNLLGKLNRNNSEAMQNKDELLSPIQEMNTPQSTQVTPPQQKRAASPTRWLRSKNISSEQELLNDEERMRQNMDTNPDKEASGSKSPRLKSQNSDKMQKSNSLASQHSLRSLRNIFGGQSKESKSVVSQGQLQRGKSSNVSNEEDLIDKDDTVSGEISIPASTLSRTNSKASSQGGDSRRKISIAQAWRRSHDQSSKGADQSPGLSGQGSQEIGDPQGSQNLNVQRAYADQEGRFSPTKANKQGLSSYLPMFGHHKPSEQTQEHAQTHPRGSRFNQAKIKSLFRKQQKDQGDSFKRGLTTDEQLASPRNNGQDSPRGILQDSPRSPDSPKKHVSFNEGQLVNILGDNENAQSQAQRELYDANQAQQVKLPGRDNNISNYIDNFLDNMDNEDSFTQGPPKKQEEAEPVQQYNVREKLNEQRARKKEAAINQILPSAKNETKKDKLTMQLQALQNKIRQNQDSNQQGTGDVTSPGEAESLSRRQYDLGAKEPTEKNLLENITGDESKVDPIKVGGVEVFDADESEFADQEAILQDIQARQQARLAKDQEEEQQTALQQQPQIAQQQPQMSQQQPQMGQQFQKDQQQPVTGQQQETRGLEGPKSGQNTQEQIRQRQLQQYANQLGEEAGGTQGDMKPSNWGEIKSPTGDTGDVKDLKQVESQYPTGDTTKNTTQSKQVESKEPPSDEDFESLLNARPDLLQKQKSQNPFYNLDSNNQSPQQSQQPSPSKLQSAPQQQYPTYGASDNSTQSQQQQTSSNQYGDNQQRFLAGISKSMEDAQASKPQPPADTQPPPADTQTANPFYNLMGNQEQPTQGQNQNANFGNRQYVPQENMYLYRIDEQPSELTSSNAQISPQGQAAQSFARGNPDIMDSMKMYDLSRNTSDQSQLSHTNSLVGNSKIQQPSPAVGRDQNQNQGSFFEIIPQISQQMSFQEGNYGQISKQNSQISQQPSQISQFTLTNPSPTTSEIPNISHQSSAQFKPGEMQPHYIQQPHITQINNGQDSQQKQLDPSLVHNDAHNQIQVKGQKQSEMQQQVDAAQPQITMPQPSSQQNQMTADGSNIEDSQTIMQGKEGDLKGSEYLLPQTILQDKQYEQQSRQLPEPESNGEGSSSFNPFKDHELLRKFNEGHDDKPPGVGVEQKTAQGDYTAPGDNGISSKGIAMDDSQQANRADPIGEPHIPQNKEGEQLNSSLTAKQLKDILGEDVGATDIEAKDIQSKNTLGKPIDTNDTPAKNIHDESSLFQPGTQEPANQEQKALKQKLEPVKEFQEGTRHAQEPATRVSEPAKGVSEDQEMQSMFQNVRSMLHKSSAEKEKENDQARASATQAKNLDVDQTLLTNETQLTEKKDLTQDKIPSVQDNPFLAKNETPITQDQAALASDQTPTTQDKSALFQDETPLVQNKGESPEHTQYQQNQPRDVILNSQEPQKSERNLDISPQEKSQMPNEEVNQQEPLNLEKELQDDYLDKVPQRQVKFDQQDLPTYQKDNDFSNKQQQPLNLQQDADASNKQQRRPRELQSELFGSQRGPVSFSRKSQNVDQNDVSNIFNDRGDRPGSQLGISGQRSRGSSQIGNLTQINNQTRYLDADSRMGSRRESGDVSDEEFYDTEDIAFATAREAPALSSTDSKGLDSGSSEEEAPQEHQKSPNVAEGDATLDKNLSMDDLNQNNFKQDYLNKNNLQSTPGEQFSQLPFQTKEQSKEGLTVTEGISPTTYSNSKDLQMDGVQVANDTTHEFESKNNSMNDKEASLDGADAESQNDLQREKSPLNMNQEQSNYNVEFTNQESSVYPDSISQGYAMQNGDQLNEFERPQEPQETMEVPKPRVQENESSPSFRNLQGKGIEKTFPLSPRKQHSPRKMDSPRRKDIREKPAIVSFLPQDDYQQESPESSLHMADSQMSGFFGDSEQTQSKNLGQKVDDDKYVGDDVKNIGYHDKVYLPKSVQEDEQVQTTRELVNQEAAQNFNKPRNLDDAFVQNSKNGQVSREYQEPTRVFQQPQSQIEDTTVPFDRNLAKHNLDQESANFAESYNNKQNDGSLQKNVEPRNFQKDQAGDQGQQPTISKIREDQTASMAQPQELMQQKQVYTDFVTSPSREDVKLNLYFKDQYNGSFNPFLVKVPTDVQNQIKQKSQDNEQIALEDQVGQSMGTRSWDKSKNQSGQSSFVAASQNRSTSSHLRKLDSQSYADSYALDSEPSLATGSQGSLNAVNKMQPHQLSMQISDSEFGFELGQPNQSQSQQEALIQQQSLGQGGLQVFQKQEMGRHKDYNPFFNRQLLEDPNQQNHSAQNQGVSNPFYSLLNPESQSSQGQQPVAQQQPYGSNPQIIPNYNMQYNTPSQGLQNSQGFPQPSNVSNQQYYQPQYQQQQISQSQPYQPQPNFPQQHSSPMQQQPGAVAHQPNSQSYQSQQSPNQQQGYGQQTQVPQSQQYGYTPPQQQLDSTQKGFQPQNSGYQPQNTDQYSRNTGYDAQYSGQQTQGSGYQPQNSGYQTQNNDYQPQYTGQQAQQAVFSPQNTGYQPYNSGYQGQNNDYERQYTGQQAHQAGHQPQNTGNQTLSRDFQPYSTGQQQQQAAFSPQNSGYQAPNNDYQRQYTGQQSQQNAFQAQNTGSQTLTRDFQPQNSGYQPQSTGYQTSPSQLQGQQFPTTPQTQAGQPQQYTQQQNYNPYQQQNPYQNLQIQQQGGTSPINSPQQQAISPQYQQQYTGQQPQYQQQQSGQLPQYPQQQTGQQTQAQNPFTQQLGIHKQTSQGQNVPQNTQQFSQTQSRGFAQPQQQNYQQQQLSQSTQPQQQQLSQPSQPQQPQLSPQQNQGWRSVAKFQSNPYTQSNQQEIIDNLQMQKQASLNQSSSQGVSQTQTQAPPQSQQQQLLQPQQQQPAQSPGMTLQRQQPQQLQQTGQSSLELQQQQIQQQLLEQQKQLQKQIEIEDVSLQQYLDRNKGHVDDSHTSRLNEQIKMSLSYQGVVKLLYESQLYKINQDICSSKYDNIQVQLALKVMNRVINAVLYCMNEVQQYISPEVVGLFETQTPRQGTAQEVVARMRTTQRNQQRKSSMLGSLREAGFEWFDIIFPNDVEDLFNQLYIVLQRYYNIPQIAEPLIALMHKLLYVLYQQGALHQQGQDLLMGFYRTFNYIQQREYMVLSPQKQQQALDYMSYVCQLEGCNADQILFGRARKIEDTEKVPSTVQKVANDLLSIAPHNQLLQTIQVNANNYAVVENVLRTTLGYGMVNKVNTENFQVLKDQGLQKCIDYYTREITTLNQEKLHDEVTQGTFQLSSNEKLEELLAPQEVLQSDFLSQYNQDDSYKIDRSQVEKKLVNELQAQFQLGQTSHQEYAQLPEPSVQRQRTFLPPKLQQSNRQNQSYKLDSKKQSQSQDIKSQAKNAPNPRISSIDYRQQLQQGQEIADEKQRKKFMTNIKNMRSSASSSISKFRKDNGL